MKKRLDLRIDADLRSKVDAQVERSGQNLTSTTERYLREGLARDSGELIEESSLPAIREAVRETVREEVAKAMAELYQQLSADLQKSAKRSDERLAALAVKAARSAGIGWRLAYAILAKSVGADQAGRTYEDAKEKAGKDISRPDETKASNQSGSGS